MPLAAPGPVSSIEGADMSRALISLSESGKSVTEAGKDCSEDKISESHSRQNLQLLDPGWCLEKERKWHSLLCLGLLFVHASPLPKVCALQS